MTNSINELDHAQVILVAGSNTTEAHPQVARRIFHAVDNGAALIVIDPRRTRLADQARIHLQLRPGTDIPLINGMMRCIIDENLIDDLFLSMRTENYFALRDMLLKVDLEETAALTGVPRKLIARAARTYARAQRSTICYCLGVTQHVCGTANVETYANLAMLTGHVEQEFTGVDPLRGQNNVQGACDMGALPAVFPGYQSVADPRIKKKFEQAWGVELPATPGLTLLDMTHNRGTASGSALQKALPRLRAMFVMGENPMLSDPDLHQVEKTLKGLDFLVVSDLFLTETARLADVVLPAASFAEKSGTVTNSERRVQLMHRAIAPIGDSRPDHRIIMSLARRMDFAMDYESPAEIMEEICLLTPIYGGMYHDRLASSHGLQWPCTDRAHAGTPYLHKYSFTRGRGRFVPASHVEPAEPVDADYPLMLITGRRYHHYHTGTMSRLCPTLDREEPRPRLDMHPDDAAALQLRQMDRVRVSSRRGSCEFNLHITPRTPPGTLYCDFHFHEAPTNKLTLATADPTARCPEFKLCAVQVRKGGAG